MNAGTSNLSPSTLNVTSDTRILVTGGSGALGWVLAERLSRRCIVIGTYFSHDCVPAGVTSVRMDLASPASVEVVLKKHRPSVIVHAAAMTDPDACERDARTARSVNLDGSGLLAGLAAEMGAGLVFLSTDLVFDGARGHYRETDKPRPLSVYGETKLEAERLILRDSEGRARGAGTDPAADEGQTTDAGSAAGEARMTDAGHSAVIRSSLIYGWGSPVSGTFFSGLHATLGAGRSMRLFTDQMRNPVFESDLADAVTIAVERDLKGLFHVAGAEAVSRYDFGRVVCEVFGFDEGLLEPITMAEFEYVAGRPLDSTLDISRFIAATGFEPLGLREGLSQLKESSRG